MLPVYLGSLILGGLLIAASIVLGGGDSELHADADIDLDMDGDFDKDFDADFHAIDGETGAWLPFLSMRFWTFGLASFGMTGTLIEGASHLDLATTTSTVTLILSGAMGVVIGWITAWAFHRLKQDSVSGDVGMRQIKGSEATVLLTVSSDKRGKIRALVDGQAVDLMALSLDESPLKRGEKALIVELREDIALVTRLRKIADNEN